MIEPVDVFPCPVKEKKVADFNPETHMLIWLEIHEPTGTVVGSYAKESHFLKRPYYSLVERIVEKPKRVTRWE